MDSDEDSRTATASLPPDSAATQESAILNFMSNLSPIKPEKAAPGPPGFPELNSPSNIFTSPHVNPLQETTHLRSQEFSLHDVSGSGIARASEESEKSRIQSSNESLQVCVDEYFANGVAMDCANSADSANSSLIRCIDMIESLKDCTESTGIICKLDNKIDAEDAWGVPTTRELVKRELQGNSSSDKKIVETDMKERSREMPTSACPGEKLDLSVDHAFQEQRREIPVAKNAGVTHKEDLGCTQFPPEALEPIQGYKDDVQNNRGVSKEPIENMILRNFEGQQHCDMQRQYLQFDEAQGNVVAENHGYDLSSKEAREAASGMHMNLINFTQPTTSMASSRNIEISKSTVSKPSGIGSHINTIMPTGCGATGNAISVDKGCLKMPTRLVPTMGCHQQGNTRNIPTLLDNRGKFLASSEGGIHEAPASGLTSTLAPQPSQIVKASNDPGFLELGEYQRTQGDKRESMNEHADAVEESNQSGPIKKRKQATGMSDDDIWKRCNCKKTKCLKLYCDCFAAGIYCAGSCTCQDCFNNLDYEDTVLDTRQQIESRNPLAFSPKIEDVNNSTPFLARHKRGCNCRKSTCVKKYCECYQANVGCSDGCRCEGCKNPYGIKEEYGVAKDVPKEGSFPEKSETQLNEQMEMATAAGQDSMLASELLNHHNLTHLTPAFQFYDSRMKDIPESRFSNSSCLPSPQSNLPLLPGERSPILPPKPDNRGMLLLKAGRGFQDSVQGLNYSNIETAMDKFSSPRYDLTTLPNHPSSSPAMAFPDSSKFVDRLATIATARSQLYPGSSHLPSGSSPYWQRPPPLTPPAAAQFGERTLTQAVDLTTQDGMLKTPNDTSTPLDDEVKSDSPSGSRLPDSPA